MKKPASFVSPIEALVDGGKAVVTADHSTILSLMLESLKSGRSATFYVSPVQGRALMRLYWSPRRIAEIGMERVSEEERKKIETELGVKDMGPMFSNRVQCSCGGVYGAFEFMEQGIREHGRDWVGAIIELKNTAVIRINPTQDAFCPKCGLIIQTSHWYEMYSDTGKLIYGCCKSDDTILA